MQLQLSRSRSKEVNLAISEQTAATIGLAALAFWNAIIYYFGFVKPAAIYTYFMYPYLDQWFLQKGAAPGLARIIFAFIALGISYFISWRLAKRAHTRAGWAILLAGTVGFIVTMLFMIPFASNDVYDNIIHGRILSIYHANPFQQIPNHFTQDIFTWYAGWPNDVSAYGPLWEIFGGLTAGLIHMSGIVQNVIAFKLLNALFFSGCILLTAAILRKRSPELALAGTLLLAWNPVLIFETFGNAHNDIVMVFFIVMSIWAMTEKQYEMALVSLVAGALVKYIPLLLLPAAGLIALRELPGWGRRLRLVVVSGAFSILMIVLAFAPFWTGLGTLTIERRSGLFTTSVPEVAANLLTKYAGTIDVARAVVSIAAAGLTLAFALAMGVRAWRNRSPDSFAISAFSTLCFYIVVTCLWYQPWYAIWLIALIPLVQNIYAHNIGVIEGFAAMGKHFIWIPLIWWKPPPSMTKSWPSIWMAIGIHGIVWLAAGYGIWRTYRKAQIEPALQPESGAGITSPEAGAWLYWPVHLAPHQPELEDQEADTLMDKRG